MGVIQFPRDARNESDVTLTGESSLSLLRDYVGSVADRGRPVPGAVRTARITWSEAPGVPWPLDNPIVCAAPHADSDLVPKHDTRTKHAAIKKLGALSINVEVAPSNAPLRMEPS